MIAANELRIGNLIEKDNVIYKFLSLEQNHASTSAYRLYWVETLDGKLGKYYSTHFNPIPLTPEILEKLGFEFDTITFSKSYFLLAEGDNGFDVWIGGLSKVKLNPIKYVHELQNLFYAITKEELNYSI